MALFSERTLGRKLRRYQREVGEQVLRSVAGELGVTFTVMMARQMGKNELSAHLEAHLLVQNQRSGGTIVKAAPTFKPQVTTSMMRLESLLRCPELRRKWKREHGYTIAVGEARALFFSGEPESAVMGATASLLLEVDEAQDIETEKYTRDFRPMASSTNATTVLWGTAWTEDSLLEQQKRENLRLEALQPGIRRHFEFDWTHGAEANEKYGRFVTAEIARLGPDHPLIRTQYLLLPLMDGGAFFSKEDQLRLRGAHTRCRVAVVHSERGSYYVAGVDVAGPAEEGTDALLRAASPRKDSTVVTICKVTPLDEGNDVLVRVQDIYWWTGRPLHEQCEQLVELLQHVWKCRKVAVDATGLGMDMAARLQVALGKEVVEGFTFSGASKSRLAYHLLSLVGRGRVQMWEDEDGATSAEAEEFWKEVRLARPAHRSGGLLSFYVPQHMGHDDFLSSLALAAWTVQPEEVVRRTPLTPTQLILPEPEDVNALPFY